MKVKDIAARFLADPDNQIVAMLKECGVPDEHMLNALMWTLEVESCNLLHILYDEKGIVDIVDTEKRNLIIRPDIWQDIELDRQGKNTQW